MTVAPPHATLLHMTTFTRTFLCLAMVLLLASAGCHRAATVSTDFADRATTAGDRWTSASADGWRGFSSPPGRWVAER